MSKFKVGERVKYVSDGQATDFGTITHVLGERFEVTWDDGETYSYSVWLGMSIHRA